MNIRQQVTGSLQAAIITDMWIINWAVAQGLQAGHHKDIKMDQNETRNDQRETQRATERHGNKNRDDCSVILDAFRKPVLSLESV